MPPQKIISEKVSDDFAIFLRRGKIFFSTGRKYFLLFPIFTTFFFVSRRCRFTKRKSCSLTEINKKIFSLSQKKSVDHFSFKSLRFQRTFKKTTQLRCCFFKRLVSLATFKPKNISLSASPQKNCRLFRNFFRTNFLRWHWRATALPRRNSKMRKLF